MKKRGQVTLFIILGLVIIAVFGILVYYRNASLEQLDVIKERKSSIQEEAITNYVESCLKTVSDEAVWRIGYFGGYTGYDENYVYYEEFNGDLFHGYKVPYYLDSYRSVFPSLEEIKSNLFDFIVLRLDSCLNFNEFEEIGYTIEKPDSEEILNKIRINLESVDVKIVYPLTIKKDDSVVKIENFRVEVPLRFGVLYESAVTLVNSIRNYPLGYHIEEGCDMYDKNGLTAVYLKDDDLNDPNSKIVQFIDYSTYHAYDTASYRLQFSVKNVAVSGECVL